MNYEACIKKSIEYIDENLNKRIELDELADKVFLSKYHFHRIFHGVMGEPVAEYIRKKRLMQAAEELLCTDQRIVDIAMRYQFGSQESFTKAFKKLYGIPPREFRRGRININVIGSKTKPTCQQVMAA